MMKVAWFSLLILSFATLLSAQDQTPVITASTAGEKVVRFGSPAAGVAQIRVQILSASGDPLFDSSWKDGNVLDLPVEMAAGAYRCVVMIKDLDGRVTQKEGVVTEDAKRGPTTTMLDHDDNHDHVL